MDQTPQSKSPDPPKADIQAQELENAQTNSESSRDVLQDKVLEGHPAQALFVHEKMNMRLFLALTAMSFLWVGSQIPLYLFGSIISLIYQDIGGVDRYTWFVIGYLIPNAALCPFVGALSDLFGRRIVGIVGQLLLILGPIVTSTAHTMNVAIAGQVFSGLGAGLNELIALTGTSEMVPVRKRATYVGAIVFTILPFLPSTLYAQLIAKASNWRYNGLLVGIWNLIGLFLVIFYSWGSAHVLVPFILGIILIIAFFVWEINFAPYPMAPRKMFTKAKRTMILILLITFISGGNYFVLLLLWPTEVYNIYGSDPISVGLHTLPIGFGIIGGAFIALLLIPLTKGRITHIMIFFTAIMTGFTAAVSVAKPGYSGPVYAIVTLASIGVGGVIIPSSIIAQIVCPDELIATVTAITLAIRYIGGAIAFTAYDNVLQHKFADYAATIVVTDTIIGQGIVEYKPANLPLMTDLVNLVATAQYTLTKELIATSPDVHRKDVAYDLIVRATQEAFALAYRYPYWMSIAFGGISLILSFGLGDIRRFLLSDRVAAHQV